MTFVLSSGSSFNFTIPALAEVYLTIPDDLEELQVNNMYTGSTKTIVVNVKDLGL